MTYTIAGFHGAGDHYTDIDSAELLDLMNCETSLAALTALRCPAVS